MSQKYVIVHFIDSAKVPFEFPKTEWPLHITLLANFIVGTALNALVEELGNYARRTKPFNVVAKDEALFGSKQNLPVSLIRPDEKIINTHKALSDIALNLGATFDESHYMGDQYRPHATIQRDSRLSESQTVTLDNFTLVDMFPGGDINRRRTIETYELVGNK